MGSWKKWKIIFMGILWARLVSGRETPKRAALKRKHGWHKAGTTTYAVETSQLAGSY
jgi:hypothetical protein